MVYKHMFDTSVGNQLRADTHSDLVSGEIDTDGNQHTGAAAAHHHD
jgi:hypothetical protein